MPSLLGRASRLALDLLYPPRCAICDGGGAIVCGACTAALVPPAGPRCRICFSPLRRGALCEWCDAAPPAYTELRAATIAEAGGLELVHQLKYGGLSSLAEPMAELIAARCLQPDVDIIVPVPLHGRRERERGYNQAALIARSLGQSWGLPAEPRALKRTRATAPLARTMRREERRGIVEGAFTAVPARFSGRRILLVDDVATTGATLDVCARALRGAGAREVHALVFARAGWD
jgi:ComF family protein